MRGQGLSIVKSGEGGGVKSPLAATADVTTELAFIANKLPINTRGASRTALFVQRIPPHRRPRCLPFSGCSDLPNTHLSYFYIVNRGQLEFFGVCVLMLRGRSVIMRSARAAVQTQ